MCLQMDWHPIKGEVSCECSGENGLTFANSFYVAPNTIDFSTVFLKFSPKDQAAVLAIFILIIVLYVILMIWGRHQDKKDIVKVCIIFLYLLHLKNFEEGWMAVVILVNINLLVKKISVLSNKYIKKYIHILIFHLLKHFCMKNSSEYF